VKVLARLNQGMDWTGKTLGGATNFYHRRGVNPLAEDLDYEITRFRGKIEAGAHFAMTPAALRSRALVRISEENSAANARFR